MAVVHHVRARFPGVPGREAPLSEAELDAVAALIGASGATDWGISHSFSNKEPTSIEGWAMYKSAAKAMAGVTAIREWVSASGHEAKVTTSKYDDETRRTWKWLTYETCSNQGS